MIKSVLMDRRTCLQGMGAALALPLLEVMGSADTIAANYVGAFTTLPSLEVATMPQTWKENQEGLNEAYYSHCSFRSPTQPVPAEINPRNVLNRLFNKKEQQERGAGSSQMSPLDQR